MGDLTPLWIFYAIAGGLVCAYVMARLWWRGRKYPPPRPLWWLWRVLPHDCQAKRHPGRAPGTHGGSVYAWCPKCERIKAWPNTGSAS